jgi:hypothetical protein|tara:strand:+ start:22 stop:183 length:162 start_codon:yes stop_codon:yes gene_type:complete
MLQNLFCPRHFFKKIDNFNEIVDTKKKLFNVAKENLKIKEYFSSLFVTVRERF